MTAVSTTTTLLLKQPDIDESAVEEILRVARTSANISRWGDDARRLAVSIQRPGRARSGYTALEPPEHLAQQLPGFPLENTTWEDYGFGRESHWLALAFVLVERLDSDALVLAASEETGLVAIQVGAAGVRWVGVAAYGEGPIDLVFEGPPSGVVRMEESFHGEFPPGVAERWLLRFLGASPGRGALASLLTTVEAANARHIRLDGHEGVQEERYAHLRCVDCGMFGPPSFFVQRVRGPTCPDHVTELPAPQRTTAPRRQDADQHEAPDARLWMRRAGIAAGVLVALAGASLLLT